MIFHVNVGYFRWGLVRSG